MGKTEMVYEKLVRDNIPQMIERQGRKVNIRILDGKEYRECLERKLDEEVREYHAGKNPEELADILEVVFALAEDLGCSRQKLMEVYDKKHAARGGFRDRIYLISAEG